MFIPTSATGFAEVRQPYSAFLGRFTAILIPSSHKTANLGIHQV
ncbi:hypothetical protein [Undibacterium sp.]